MRSVLIYIFLLFMTGCDGGADTGDTAYSQDARVRGPEVGWRPVDLPGGFALE